MTTLPAPGLPPVPATAHGAIALHADNCTSCLLCVKECPDWCITLDFHKETIPATTPHGRDRQVKVLDRFAIDWSLCMYCGICVDVCPFDALFWSPEYAYPGVGEHALVDLLHEKERLAAFLPSVPAEALPAQVRESLVDGPGEPTAPGPDQPAGDDGASSGEAPAVVAPADRPTGRVNPFANVKPRRR